MCGRFACDLDPTVVCHACQYRNTDGQLQEPKWIDNPRVQHFRSSSNIAPTNYSPVLLSGKHLATATNPDGQGYVWDRVIQPMRFGLIPSWHKGQESGSHLATINCRREGIMEKNTFAVPLKKGRRCVVLAEGFYAWKKLDKSTIKQPYIIYLPDEKEFLEADNKEARISSETSKVPCLLKFAAVFDVWHPAEVGPVYSYSILTVDAAKSLRWIHDRMPAVLRSEEDVAKWLDFEGVSVDEALRLIHPVEDLISHPVTPAMGNVGYKHPDASKPISPEQAQSGQSPLLKGQTSLMSFFSVKNKTAPSEEPSEQPALKTKR